MYVSNMIEEGFVYLEESAVVSWVGEGVAGARYIRCVLCQSD